MDCQAVDERLSDYLDESLPGEEMERVAEHLSACLVCRQAAEDLRATVAAVRYEPVPAASPEFWTKLYARIEQEGGRTPAPRGPAPAWLAWVRGSWRIPRLVAAGALAASLVIAAVATRTPPEAVAPKDDIEELISQHADQSAVYTLSDWPRLTFVSTEINAAREDR